MARHAGALEDFAHLVERHVGHDRLADRGAVGFDPATDFGEHPHGVPGLSLCDIDDLVAVEHREMADSPSSSTSRARCGRAHTLSILEEASPSRISRGPRTYCREDSWGVAEVDERPQQPVDRGQGEAGLVCELRERERAAGIGHQFEERKGAPDRLHRSVAGLGSWGPWRDPLISYAGSLVSAGGGSVFPLSRYCLHDTKTIEPSGVVAMTDDSDALADELDARLADADAALAAAYPGPRPPPTGAYGLCAR